MNLALNKPAYQSSDGHMYGLAEHAVDGNPDGDYWRFSCTHTTDSHMPWWAVDLGSDEMVSHVQISNRVDSESSSKSSLSHNKMTMHRYIRNNYVDNIIVYNLA